MRSSVAWKARLADVEAVDPAGWPSITATGAVVSVKTAMVALACRTGVPLRTCSQLLLLELVT